MKRRNCSVTPAKAGVQSSLALADPQDESNREVSLDTGLRRYDGGRSGTNGLLALLVALFSCAPSFTPIVTLQDATNDDHGPGSYRYPADRLHTPGSYDLTAVRIGLSGEEVVVRVDIRGWFGAKEGKDASRNNTARGLPPSLQNEEVSGYSLQNIELYIDTDANPNTGFHAALPGRGVSIEGGWEKAIWLSPSPSKARAALSRRSPEMAPYVIIPTELWAKNHTLEARFSASELPQKIQKTWGYTVLVSGALLDDSFGNKDAPMLRPVSPTADESTFLGSGAPIIDLWTPESATPSQEKMLQKKAPKIAARNGAGELFAAVRVATAGQATSQPASTSAPVKEAKATATILDEKGGVVSLRVMSGSVKVGQLGELRTSPGVYLLVTEVIGEICVAKVVRAETSDLFVAGGELVF